MEDQIRQQSEIHSWPKVELHCHLEGALRPQTILDLYRKNGGRHHSASLEELLPLVQVTGSERNLFECLAKFDTIMPSLRTISDLERITHEVIEDASRDRVVYLELRYCPHFIAEYSGLSAQEAAEAVVVAKEAAAVLYPVHVELILIVPQYGGEKVAEEALDLALAYQRRGVRAMDVAGDIRQLGLEIYTPVFRRAAKEGLGITIHAGEITPADTVRMAVDEMFATRIGHGIRAIDDPDVIKLLIERKILLEVCVSSNLQTRATPSLREHPIGRLIDQGVLVSVNTDDPGISNIVLSDEYALLINSLGFSPRLLKRLNLQAVDAAFTTPEVKEKIRQKLAEGQWE